MGRRRRSAPAKHPVSSSHPGHPTPGWELRVLGTGARELRRLCDAATRARHLQDRCPWAVELSPSRKGSHPDSLRRSRKSGEPQICPLVPPSLTPLLHTPTWTEAVTPSGLGRDSSKAGAHAELGGLLSTLGWRRHPACQAASSERTVPLIGRAPHDLLRFVDQCL